MITLIGNELRKTRREMFGWVLLLLNTIPLVMVVVNHYVNAGSATLRSFYFTFHNQYLMVLPIVVCAAVASFFHTEFRNRTYVEWLTTGRSKAALWTAKYVVALAMTLGFALVNFLGLCGFLLVENPDVEFGRLAAAFWTMVGITVPAVSLPSALLTLVTRNVIVVTVLGVLLTIVTLVLMAADFSFVLPTSLAYRLGAAMLDPALAYPDPGTALVIGGTVTLILIVVSLVLNLVVVTGRRHLR